MVSARHIDKKIIETQKLVSKRHFPRFQYRIMPSKKSSIGKKSNKFKISKQSSKSTSSKVAKLNEIDIYDVVNSTACVKPEEKKSALDSKCLKLDHAKDVETKQKDKELSKLAEGDLMKQLDNIL